MSTLNKRQISFSIYELHELGFLGGRWIGAAYQYKRVNLVEKQMFDLLSDRISPVEI